MCGRKNHTEKCLNNIYSKKYKQCTTYMREELYLKALECFLLS